MGGKTLVRVFEVRECKNCQVRQEVLIGTGVVTEEGELKSKFQFFGNPVRHRCHLDFYGVTDLVGHKTKEVFSVNDNTKYFEFINRIEKLKTVENVNIFVRIICTETDYKFELNGFRMDQHYGEGVFPILEAKYMCDLVMRFDDWKDSRAGKEIIKDTNSE